MSTTTYIFSRYLVGWMVSEREDAEVAKAFVAETIAKQGHPFGLSIHADRGTAQTAKPLALLMADFGVTNSHSRPHTSKNNPLLGGDVQDHQVVGRASRHASAASRTPGCSSGRSSAGTTNSTATPASP